MFDFRAWTKRGILNSIGQAPEYKVIENVNRWVDKGVLVIEDVAEIQAALDDWKSQNSAT